MGRCSELSQRRITDLLLEAEIVAVSQRLLLASNSNVKRIYARSLADLIALRSPAQVARMEQARGLG